MQNEQPQTGGNPTDPSTGISVTTKEIEALKSCIETAMAEYARKGRRNKKGAIAVQIILIILSAFTTILIGWKFEDKQPSILLTNLALICSAIVAGMNVVNAFFDYKELWGQYKAARNQLNMLLSELCYLQASGEGNITQTQLGGIFDQYKSICENTNKVYQQLRMAKDSTEQ